VETKEVKAVFALYDSIETVNDLLPFDATSISCM
jgi:hypothetical protein